MYTDSIQARREIARNFTELNYRINPLHWQTLCMGVNRDLQAKNCVRTSLFLRGVRSFRS
jgi:hypothetical protein